jgi:hypothetical protein
MKPVAWTIILAIAAPALAWAAPQQAPDGIVQIRKKGSTWYFKVLPEERRKSVVDEKEVDIDIPQRLSVVWAPDEAYAPLRGQGSLFAFPGNSDTKTVNLYREGKRYGMEVTQDIAELKNLTRDELAELQKSMMEEFYQFDLEFPGGSWEELAKLLRERLAAAYEQQIPDLLKPYLPAKVEIDLSTKAAQHARYPAIQGKNLTLALLRAFGPGPIVEGKTESTPRVVQREDNGLQLVMDVSRSLARLVLSDRNALGSDEPLDVAFFHLGTKPNLAGADVVALFEMAWKARIGPLYAKVKYHPETKTLMVQGTQDELFAADKVFATLTGRPAPVAPSSNPFDSLNETLNKIAELLHKQVEDKEKDK